MPTEQELLDKISSVQSDIFQAKREMSEARKLYNAAETKLIAAQLTLEKLQPQLEEWHALYSPTEQTAKSKEIAAFSEKFPELVALAKERDGIK